MNTRSNTKGTEMSQPLSEGENVSSPLSSHTPAAVDATVELLQKMTEQLMRLQHDTLVQNQANMEHQQKEAKERQLFQEEQLKVHQTLEKARLDQELKLAMERLEREEAAHKQTLEERQGREDARDMRQQLDKLAQTLAPWRDADQPASYLLKFEEVMTAAKIDQETWPVRLTSLLTGKALQAYSTDVPPEAKTSYATLKEALLTALGSSKEACQRQFWGYRRKQTEPPTDTLRELLWLAGRLLEGCTTMDEATQRMATGKFLSLFNPADADYVTNRKPTTTLEYGSFMVDRLALQTSHGDSRSPRPWYPRSDYQQRQHHDEAPWRREQQYPSQRRDHSSRPTSPPAGRRPDQTRSSNSDSRPVVCYGCGQRGHKRPDCPEQVRRVTSPTPTRSLYVSGAIGGSQCSKFLIDSGATHTVVHNKYIKPQDLTGRHVRLIAFDKTVQDYPLATIKLQVGKHVGTYDVAVVNNLDADALLGMDLNLLDYLLYLHKMEKALPVFQTRAQEAKEQAVQQQEDDETQQSGANLINLGDIFDFDEEVFQTDSPTQAPVQAVPDASLTDPEPLPQLPLDHSDKKELIEQQKDDVSLAHIRDLARKLEKGYLWEEGLLVHRETDELGLINTRVVLPETRRRPVLKLAHSALTGGHFGRRKTQERIRRHFTWPGLTADTKNYCSTCPECQKAAPHHHKQAPLNPLPVITTPFRRIAFDIVGPLPRTRSGYKYILTSMCYGTKYPEAIPLKKVTAEVVAEAMVDVFSRTGIPEEILTDQGSVFVGRIVTHMCLLLGIHHLKTSPYHPQSDGMLERWHASLKAMLKKATKDRQNWDLYLKFLLFSYRDTPHTVTGYSPFELIYGKNVRGPLEVLKASWISGDTPAVAITDWVEELKRRMTGMAEIVQPREEKAKHNMKAYYDKKATAHEYQVGSMVLIRTPQLTGKLEDRWEGPYEVVEKVSNCNYKIAIPGRENRSRILHVNMLKSWKTVDNTVMRVILATEDAPTQPEPPPGLTLPTTLSPTQSQQLQDLWSEFSHILTTKPGVIKTVQHEINTADSPPIRSAPYRLAPAWKDQLRQEIHSLRDAGILEPSMSPWSSPLLPVRKPDGNIRICIDYRRINTATVPDPYLMPRIDDIIDTLAEATYITTMDLNKGFHQVPVKPSDIPKTAFCTPWGKFQYRMMPFGLRNAPATFQRLMDQALDDLLDFSRAYMDDLVVFSGTWEEHLQHLHILLSRLSNLGLTVKPTKCTWAAATCSFLGHTVGRGKVSPMHCKVTAITSFQKPVTKTDIRSFLGLTGYYRKFVADYAQNSSQLSMATKKDAPPAVQWTTAMENEFMHLKQSLSHLPSLIIPTDSDTFLLQTDASARGIGAVLTVVRDEVEYPTAFFSRRLSTAESHYSAIELEGLAVVCAVEHFNYYLVCRPFIIQSDHRALSFLQTTRHLNGRLAGWALRLQHYSFTITYRPGKDNCNADGLSRQAWVENTTPK